MGDGSTIRHNSLVCDAPDVPPDAGCSADLTGYGDFAPIRNNTIDKNFFLATTGGTCAYGGPSGDGTPTAFCLGRLPRSRSDSARRACQELGVGVSIHAQPPDPE
jgi:hypothetical protein